MTGFPTIDGIASALSLVLAALASLRAASRLERRMSNGGSIGLMDGPPILGPTAMPKEVAATDGPDDPSSPLRESDGFEGDVRADGNRMAEASPLWEHTEAFRRAVILGLLSDEIGGDASGSIFSDIARSEGDVLHVKGGSEEDFALAAAVEAGLLAPSSTLAGGGARHRVRGGEASAQLKRKRESNGSRNPLGMMTSWLVRELSAPMAAVPALHGLVCSYLRQQKENKLRESQWCLLTPYERLRFWFTGKGSGRVYDPSGLDFDASISASARIPSGVVSDGSVDSLPSTKAVRVKAFAPKTFRDLRNKCFRISEREYARSILNAMNGAIFVDDIRENSVGAPITMADPAMPNGFNGIKRIRQSNNQALPYISFQSNSKGAARAGTFFFFTADGAFMIKTVKKEEARAYHEMLPEYHRFMSENVNRRNSLLTRIFGMYSVQFRAEANAQPSAKEGDRWGGGLYSSGRDAACDVDEDERVYLVMHSVFPPDASAFITERFDLKGSTVGRECSLEERRTKGANAVLKDLDLKQEVAKELNGDDSSGQNRTKGSRYGICIGKRRKTALMAQLERDVDLLHRCNVLDYSLLVGVADMERSMAGAKPNATNKRVPKCLQNFFLWLDFPMPYYGAGMTKVNGGALSCLEGSRKGKHVMYYMGVIDFLQPWTVKKRLERDLKGLAGMDKTAISCVAPAAYASRFLKFVNSHVT